MNEKIDEIMRERLNFGDVIPEIIILTSYNTIGATDGAFMPVSRLHKPLTFEAFTLQSGQYAKSQPTRMSISAVGHCFSVREFIF